MRQVVGIIGSGQIGIDPFHPQAWSGSSRRFFTECSRQGLLKRAFGVEVSLPGKVWYRAWCYARDRTRWTTQYIMCRGYRDALTSLIERRLTADDFTADLLQIGALYNVPRITRGRTRCFSYNDGNFQMSLGSPYFPPGISAARIDRTLRYEREVTEGLDLIFTMSEFLRRTFIDDYGVAPERVVCIGAGINIDVLPELGRSRDYSTASLLFIGVDFRRKGGGGLAKAFKVIREKVPRATLHIVGPREPLPEVQGMPGVVWHGYLDKGQPGDARKLASLIDSASLLILPSLYEPFGIAPLEAMAHEIPCVVSNAWALPEIVPDRVCGRLVDPGNWEALAEITIGLLKDPDLLARYGKAGRRHVENYYTWEKVVHRLKEALPAVIHTY